MKEVSVVIATYNSAEVILTCLKSIQNGTKHSFEIIVVDNASKDRTAEIIQKFPEVIFIQNQNNLGFAKANNQGLRRAEGKYVLFLNPDTEAQGGGIDTLLESMEREPEIAMITGQLCYPDGALQSNIKRNLTLSSLLELFIALKVPRTGNHFKSLAWHLAKDFDYHKPQNVEQIMGACMLTRTSLVKEINGFDEDYFIWFEDLQLCLEYQKRKWPIAYTPQAHFIHHEGHSFKRQPRLSNQLNFLRSIMIFTYTNWPLSHTLVIWLLAPFALIVSLTMALLGARPKVQSKL